MAKLSLVIGLDSPLEGFCTSTPWDLSFWDFSKRTQLRGKAFFLQTGMETSSHWGFPVRFSLSFITRETGFGQFRQLMCSEVLKGPFLPQEGVL